MGWKAKARYYPSKKGYYVQLAGKKVCLAHGAICDKCAAREDDDERPTCRECLRVREQADLRFAEIQHMDNIGRSEDSSLIFALCNKYLDEVRATCRPRTLEINTHVLRLFSEAVGHMRVKELKTHHVKDWLDKMALPRETTNKLGIKRVYQWGRGSRAQGLDCLKAMFTWAVKMEYVTRNPLVSIPKMARASRTRDALITREEHDSMIAELRKQYSPRYWQSKNGYYASFPVRRKFLLFKGPEGAEGLAVAQQRLDELRVNEGGVSEFEIVLRLLFHTGARPGELYNATAAEWNDKLAAFVYVAHIEPEKVKGFTHKTARKGRERTVFISCPFLRAIIRQLVSKHPTGPLLRNRRGGKWTDYSVYWRLGKLVSKLGLNSSITPYSYRHSSITSMVLAGVPVAHVAALHGTSIAMIERHYNHPDGHKATLGEIWAKAKANE